MTSPKVQGHFMKVFYITIVIALMVGFQRASDMGIPISIVFLAFGFIPSTQLSF